MSRLASRPDHGVLSATGRPRGQGDSMNAHSSRLGRFDESDRFLRIDTSLGPVVLAATKKGLRGLWFDGQHYFPTLPDDSVSSEHPVLQEAEKQVQDYLAGRRPAFDLPLDLSHGTQFQQSVWAVLCKVPFGTVTSYSALAKSLGRPDAVRAVGAAIGRNPISMVVPCHRVLGADGSLTGYAGGLPRKRTLLKLEGHANIPE